VILDEFKSGVVSEHHDASTRGLAEYFIHRRGG
jgi:hypothetical protein